jgi:integrase
MQRFLADKLADKNCGGLVRKRHESRLHLLSVRQVQTASEGDHGDGGGLLLRVRGDSAQFIFRFTAPSGKRREMGLGPCHRSNPAQAGASLTTARDFAAAARAQVRRGIDPIEEREQSKAAAREAAVACVRPARRATLAWCARDYHERVIEPTRTAKHAAQWISSLENHIPPKIWNKPVDEVDAPELLEALRTIRPHKRARNVPRTDRLDETVQRIRQRLDAVFEDAMFHKRCMSNPAAAIKRKIREARVRREKGAFKALPFVEAPALVSALRKHEGTAARCLEFAMLTAARTNEVITAEWTEFDLDASVWVVPAAKMKAREPHTVYLSPQALGVLRQVQDLNARYVFPSPCAEAKPLSNMAMLTLLARMKVRDRTTVHGLCRATFSTWAYEMNVARPDVIEACLAHREEDLVKAAYNRAQFARERRELLAAWANYVAPCVKLREGRAIAA